MAAAAASTIAQYSAAYAVFCAIGLLILAGLIALSTYFKSPIGLGLTLVVEVAPLAVLAYEGIRRL